MPTATPFSPVSVPAEAITNMFYISMSMVGAILLIVLVLVFYASFRFRARPGDDVEPVKNFGNSRLEWAWTILPALLMVSLLILTILMVRASDRYAPADQEPDLVVTGYQWWWELKYPKLGVTTANEVHLPEGHPSLTRILGGDVIHSFWVPQLGRKMDAVPGHPNHMWLQSDETGTYWGTCSEYCGAQHAGMHIRVIVQSEADFEAWAKRQARVPPAPTSGLAAEGAALFNELPCRGCHTIAGTPAQAHVGPDLTYVSTRETLGAGVIDNSMGNLYGWLLDTQAIKPECHMPNMNLSSEQVAALVTYLEALK